MFIQSKGFSGKSNKLKITSLLSSENISNECKYVHSLVDKGEVIFLDEAYSNLLNLIHEFFEKFVKMTYDIGHAMSKANVNKMNKLIESYNNMESFDILKKLKIETKASVKHNPHIDANSNFKIIFDDQESRVCCNEKCKIF